MQFISGSDSNSNITADVLVYGATPSGIIASIEAAKLGKQVVLLEPTQHVGGMMSNGLGATDQYANNNYGGLTSQFFQQIYTYYNGDPNAGGGFYFEPHVAEAQFNSMLANYGNISLVLGTDISSIAMSGTTINTLAATNGVTYQATEFIDASYTGDLMADAGVTYTVGREASTQYNESVAGVGVLAPITPSPIDPYVIPGNPESGLIAHVSPDTLGPVGWTDTAVMSYNYRLC